MRKNQCLLYGANGYTGRLITSAAASYNLQLILAGRSEMAITQMAAEYHYDYRVIDLSNYDSLVRALSEVSVVLHAAGPFRFTAETMIRACIEAKTHYIDITGEIEVFEMARQFDQAAKQAGIMLLPGAGFDVVPTDCLALYLSKKLPGAIYLKLAFASTGGGLSHGTALTMVEGLGQGGAVRKNGKIIKKPLAHKKMVLHDADKKIFVATIPWGDVSTGYFTTGIPNIETYTTIPENVFRILKFQGLFNWLLRLNFIRGFIRRKIQRSPAGPSAEKRKKSKTLVWGEVINEIKERRSAKILCSDGYTFTAHSSALIIQKILNGEFKTGYQTPASAYGEDLVLQIPGTVREDLQ